MNFTEVAAHIDRFYPPKTMRTLAKRFRYVGVEPGFSPPGIISLRAIEARVNENKVKKLEFLHYNTWLIKDNFKLVDIIKSLGGWGRFMDCMGLGYADILAGVLERIGSSEICDKFFPPIFSACGVSINPLNDTCKLVGNVSKLASYLIEKLGNTIDWIFDQIDAPFNIIADVVFGNLGSVIPGEISLKEAPCIDNRVIAIGDQAFAYDLISLCEVWRQEHKNALLGRGPATPAMTGPRDPNPGEWEHMGSGLLVFSPKFSIMDGGNHVYETTGVSRSMPGGCDFGRMVDSDEWARKGIQRTLVDVGYGIIEIYSTHLYSGGDMGSFFEYHLWR